MSYVGQQDFWVVGSRFFFKREAIEGVEQPWTDFGVIQEASPTFTIEKLELQDPDGGRKTLVDETISKVDETYNLRCSNFNQDNLSMIFLAKPAEASTQSASTLTSIDHSAFPGQLVKLIDSGGTETYNATSISAITSSGAVLGTTLSVADIDKTTGKITLDTGDAAGLLADDVIVLFETNLTDVGNAGSYKIESIAGDILTLYATSAAFLSSSQDMTGSLGAAKPVTTGTGYLKGIDYDVTSLQRGFVRMLSTGAFAAAATVEFWYTVEAISGVRKIIPQSAGDIKGEAKLFFSRDAGASESVRNLPSISITPSSPNLSPDAYSDWSCEVKVLSDANLANPVGDLTYIKGDLPS